jgi:hypothetical protein
LLPTGWQDRLVKIQNQNTDLKIGYCLEPHDLAASKLAAGREKDWHFVATLLQHGIAYAATLHERVATLPRPAERCAALQRWVAARSSP